MVTAHDSQFHDGSAGDVDYGRIGLAYTNYRVPDVRIAALVQRRLGPGSSLINVGAGAGGYEPDDWTVTAVEPSATMRVQRRAGLGPAVDAVAEDLPFPDRSFDAAMATFTVHQWRDVQAGLREMRRVTRGPVVILTCDPTLVDEFWLHDYAAEVLEAEARRYPSLDVIREGLGEVDVTRVPIPLDCTDGFNEAYYGRPERLLDPEARQSCSAWSFIDPIVHERFTTQLRDDLTSGRWDRIYGHLREQPEYLGALILVVSPGA